MTCHSKAFFFVCGFEVLQNLWNNRRYLLKLLLRTRVHINRRFDIILLIICLPPPRHVQSMGMSLWFCNYFRLFFLFQWIYNSSHALSLSLSLFLTKKNQLFNFLFIAQLPHSHETNTFWFSFSQFLKTFPTNNSNRL